MEEVVLPVETEQVVEQQTEEKTQQEEIKDPIAFLGTELQKRDKGLENALDNNVSRETLTEKQQNEQVETVVEVEQNQQQSTNQEYDLSKFFEEKTGGKFKSWDEIESALSKQNEPQFANETSKKIYEAAISGNEEILEDYYSKRKFVKSLQQQPTENVVKAYIKEKLPDLTETELDRYYSKNYGVNEDAFEDEIDLSIAKKEASAKLNQIKDEAINYFSKQAESITLPEIKVEQNQPELLDLNSEQAKTVASFVENLLKSDKSFNNGAFDEISIEYSNPKNGANIQGKIKLDSKQLQEMEEKIGDYPDVVFAQTYLKNGEFDKKRFIKDMYTLRNVDKLLKAATAEGYNQGFLAKMSKDKNIVTQPQKTGAVPQVAEDVVSQAKFYKWAGFSDEKILAMTGVDMSKVS